MLYSINSAAVLYTRHNVNKGKVPFALQWTDEDLEENHYCQNNPWAVFIPLSDFGGAGVPFLFAEFSLSSIESLHLRMKQEEESRSWMMGPEILKTRLFS